MSPSETPVVKDLDFGNFQVAKFRKIKDKDLQGYKNLQVLIFLLSGKNLCDFTHVHRVIIF